MDNVDHKSDNLRLSMGLDPPPACGWDCPSIDLGIGPTFKVIVLRDQNELSGPSQHCTIPIYVSHDSPDDSGAIAQL